MQGRRAGLVAVLSAALFAMSVSSAAAAPKPTPGEVVDEQDFTDPTPPPGWIIVEQQSGGSSIKDGAVIAHLEGPNQGQRVLTTQPAPQLGEYAVEVDTTLLAGDPDKTAWGVTCHGTIDQQYSFFIGTDPDIYAAITREDATDTIRLDKNNKAQKKRTKRAIKRKDGAVNTVRGECLEGGVLRMFVNGKFVAKATDPNPLPAGSTWGFEPITGDTDEPLQVSFDNFKLYDLT
jgi:hypothetical protein